MKKQKTKEILESQKPDVVLTRKLRKKEEATLTASFEFLTLPKDREDEFYRDNARIFLRGERERIMHEEYLSVK